MKLSIVVPSFNQAQFIRRTLDSLVLEADGNALEVIVQDAQSTDGTKEILDEFRHYPFIEIYIEQDMGQSDALNRGFRRSSGDILGWLNSDDVLTPGSVQAIVNTFREHPATQLVYADALFIDEEDAVIDAYPTGRLSLEVLRHRCVISQPSTFFLRDCYFESGGIRDDLHYCMDYEFWTRLLLQGVQVERLNRVVSCTRIHDETKTNTGGLAFIEEILDMQRKLFGTPSPVWSLYERTRTRPLSEIPGKLLRFALAAVQQAVKEPTFLIYATRSLLERQASGRRSRKLLKGAGQDV